MFLIISPFDLIPDFILFFGQIDDLILLSFVLDYFFLRLDSQIILDHFPYSQKHYHSIRAAVAKFVKLSPQHLFHWLWQYKPSNPAGIDHVN